MGEGISFEMTNEASATVIRGGQADQELHITTEADAEVIPSKECTE